MNLPGLPSDLENPVATTARRAALRGARVLVLALGTLAASATVSAAQLVRGRVLDELTSSPVVGAHVILIDSAGTSSFSTLTTDQGVFALRVPSRGRYHVRVEMIGRRSVESRAFTVADVDVTDVAIGMPPDPVVISGIDVRAAQQCQVRPTSGVPTQRVWEEARKALSVEVAVREQRLYRFDITSFVRELDESGRRVVSEQARFVTRFSGDPFVSRPAAELAERGYIEPDGDDWILYAPNGNVLLSDPFLDTHCFFLRRDGDHKGEIGLAFEPVRSRRIPDIEGVLWLNEQTAELRSLEFSYRNLPSDVPAGGQRGSGEFQRLPNGAFIVRDWSIRSPRVVMSQGTFAGQRVGGERVAGYHVEGGEVINIFDRSGTAIDGAPRAVLAGMVYDSTRGIALDSAVITLIGTNYAGATGADGRFRLPNLPPGVYEVAFRHPRTDAWRWSPAPIEVELERGVVTEIALGIPKAGPPLVIISDAARRDSIAELGRAFGHPEWAFNIEAPPVPIDLEIDTTGLPGRMRGRVFDDARRSAITGASVEIDSGLHVTQTDEDGRFRIDGIRPGIHKLIIRQPGYLRSETRFAMQPRQSLDAEAALARSPTDSSGAGPVSQPPRAADPVPPARPPVESGTGSRTATIHGRVIDIDDGKAIGSVAVTIAGTSRTVMSNDAGRFSIDGLAPGMRTLDLRILGYGDRSVPLEIGVGVTADIVIQLARNPVPLPPISVEVRSSKLAEVGFYDRRDAGFNGYRFTKDDIERLRPTEMTDLVARIPAALVRNAEPGSRIVHFRRWPGNVGSIGRNGEYGCIPDVYLDGILVQDFPEVRSRGTIYTPRLRDYNVAPPSEIEAIEMYVGANGPIQYRHPCGVVLVWTRR